MEQILVFYNTVQTESICNKDYIHNQTYFNFVDELLSSIDLSLLSTIRAPPDETPSKHQHLLGPRWPKIAEDLNGMCVDDAFKICKKYYRIVIIIKPNEKPYTVEGAVFLKNENGLITNFWIT
jgi:hypothetical protein